MSMCQHQYFPWEWTRDDSAFYLRCIHCKEIETFEVDTQAELYELFDMNDNDDDDYDDFDDFDDEY